MTDLCVTNIGNNMCDDSQWNNVYNAKAAWGPLYLQRLNSNACLEMQLGSFLLSQRQLLIFLAASKGLLAWPLNYFTPPTQCSTSFIFMIPLSSVTQKMMGLFLSLLPFHHREHFLATISSDLFIRDLDVLHK